MVMVDDGVITVDVRVSKQDEEGMRKIERRGLENAPFIQSQV